MAIDLNFTKGAIERLQPPEKRTQFRDSGNSKSIKGLYLYLGTTGSKVFYYRRKLNGKAVAVRLGDFPALSVENARKKAESSADTIVNDEINPNQARREKKSAELTFHEAFDIYMKHASARKKKPHQESTAINYRRSFDQHFGNGSKAKSTSPNWASTPLSSITPEQVSGWYIRASDDSITSANSAVAVGRAVFTHTIKSVRKLDRSAIYHFNPFADIEQDVAAPRNERILSDQLPDWFAAVKTLKNKTTQDYLLTLLLTGMRRRECSTLTWDRIDFKQGTVTIGERILRGGKREKGTSNRTKAGNVLVLPLSNDLLEMLKQRREADPQGSWVFPSPNSKAGYILEPKTAIAAIYKRSGIKCSPHGLRRTFATLAHDKANVPFLQVKRLMNHSQGRDVTEQHYLNETELEDLRRNMQAITDTILFYGEKKQASITRLRAV